MSRRPVITMDREPTIEDMQAYLAEMPTAPKTLIRTLCRLPLPDPCPADWRAWHIFLAVDRLLREPEDVFWAIYDIADILPHHPGYHELIQWAWRAYRAQRDLKAIVRTVKRGGSLMHAQTIVPYGDLLQGFTGPQLELAKKLARLPVPKRCPDRYDFICGIASLNADGVDALLAIADELHLRPDYETTRAWARYALQSTAELQTIVEKRSQPKMRRTRWSAPQTKIRRTKWPTR